MSKHHSPKPLKALTPAEKVWLRLISLSERRVFSAEGAQMADELGIPLLAFGEALTTLMLSGKVRVTMSLPSFSFQLLVTPPQHEKSDAATLHQHLEAKKLRMAASPPKPPLRVIPEEEIAPHRKKAAALAKLFLPDLTTRLATCAARIGMAKVEELVKAHADEATALNKFFSVYQKARDETLRQGLDGK